MDGKLKAIYYALECAYKKDNRGYKDFTAYVKDWYGAFITKHLEFYGETMLKVSSNIGYDDLAEFILNEGLIPFIYGESMLGGYVKVSMESIIESHKDEILKRHKDILLTDERKYFE